MPHSFVKVAILVRVPGLLLLFLQVSSESTFLGINGMSLMSERLDPVFILVETSSSFPKISGVSLKVGCWAKSCSGVVCCYHLCFVPY